jgi:Protein of unknown function (DUF3667)
MPATPIWICPTCRVTLASAHCPTCGERLLQARDLTIVGLLTHVFQSLSSVDGRLLRTFRSLLTRPGELTVAYLQGPRKPFIAPFQFFLIVNVLFFAVQSVTGNAVFSTPLESHLHSQDWKELAQQLVDARLQVLNTTLDAYTPLFNQAVAMNAKSLVILMTLPFALLLVPMFHDRDRPFVTHIVFSLQFYAFLLVLLCVLLGLLFVDITLGGPGIGTQIMDWGLFAALLLAASIYLYIAIGRVYSARGITRVLRVAVLTVAVASGVLGYRFAVFLITLYWS